MDYRTVLLSVVIFGLALAQTYNGSSCVNIDSSSFTLSQWNNLVASAVAGTDDEHRWTLTRQNYPGTTGVAGKMAGGACQGWSTDVAPTSWHWAVWDLTSRPASESITAWIQLTEPQSTDQHTERLMLVSTTAPAGNSANQMCVNSNAISNLWTCEAFIMDSCQGYRAGSDQKAYTLVGGRKYIFLLDSPEARPSNTSVEQDLHIKLVLKPSGKRGQDWESGVTVGTSSPFSAGVLPTGWNRTTSATNSRGWDIFATTTLVPGFDPSDWSTEVWGIASARQDLIGNTRGKIAMVNPNWYADAGVAYRCDENFDAGACNHSNDELYSIAYNTAGAGKKYDLIIDTFFYDGRNKTNSVAGATAKIYISNTGGQNSSEWTLLYKLKTVISGYWIVEEIAIPSAFANATTYFKFQFQSVDGKLGWALDSVRVTERDHFDQCDDKIICSADRCLANATLGQFGCYSGADLQTCDQKTVDCHGYSCSLDINDPTADSDGCVFTIDPENCDDHIYCTDDQCNAEGKCINTPRPMLCNDGRGCTQDYCLNAWDENLYLADADGCFFQEQCDDEVDCTHDSCEEAAIGGDKCLHRIDFNACEDFLDCTYELVCDPEQPGMDPVRGCIRIPMDEWCNDANPCTIDTCEPYSEHADPITGNACVHTDMNCDDCIPCTDDSCEEGACVNEAVHDHCDDDVHCTYDVCNKELGKCQNIPLDDLCYGHEGLDACDTYQCRPYQEDSNEWGCVVKKTEVCNMCDDDLACTSDKCVDGTCYNEAHDDECYDGEDRCTDDYCSKDLHKCVNVPNSENCDDNSVCTVNFCGPDGRCYFPEVDFSDDIWCTEDKCDPETGITNRPNDYLCNDGFECTDDSCDVNLGGCTNIPSHKWCTENRDPCHTWFCNTPSGDEAGCYGIEIECDDGIPCTVDDCDMLTGNCTNIPDSEACNDNSECNSFYCDEVLGCVINADNSRCEDNNPCTIDICGCDGKCYNEEIVCDDQIACTTDYCDINTGNCTFYIEPLACYDGIDCTFDECDVSLGRCVNTEYNQWCNKTNECTTGYCSIQDKGCVYDAHPKLCDDNIPCTDDVCSIDTGCSNPKYDTLCNDGIDCTSDACVPDAGGCVFSPIVERCADDFNCTTDFCSTKTGCYHVADDLICDDGIDCTADTCSEKNGCDNKPMDTWCNDNLACTHDVCNYTTGKCDHKADHFLCDDGWNCTTDYCNTTSGRCEYTYNDCPWIINSDPLCLECTTSSAQILQLNYTDGTGAIQFATRATGEDELKANLVALPTDQVIIGGQSQQEVHVSKSDGLVVNDNFRLVPLEDGDVVPACNEIKRGSLIVVEEAIECINEAMDNACFRDVIKICSKQQDYEWVPLSN